MDKETLIQEAKRWLEQERAWDPERHMEKTIPVKAPAAVSASATRPAISSIPTPMESAASLPAKAPVSQTKVGPHGRAMTPKGMALRVLYEKYKNCVVCPLGESRIRFVFGVGSPEASVLFVGEGPGYQEDRQGEPFVGPAGQLLDKIMASVGLDRQNVYIANIVKCHPMINPKTPDARGNDRPPTPDEATACSPILQRQIRILQPRVIVSLGSPATKAILKTTEGISKVRGQLTPFPIDSFFTESDAPLGEEREKLASIQVLPTYHPAALLRNPDLKRDVWNDMKLLRERFLSAN